MILRAVVLLAGLALAVLPIRPAGAQVAVTPASDQDALLASPDPRLAAGKRLVYDFWREVLEGGHLELADKYLAEGYIQHNPNLPTGRAAFVAFFSHVVKPQPIQAQILAPLVGIVAERDLVVLSFASTRPDPKDRSRRYTTTWFDMFRVENDRIVEHWDCAPRE